MHTIYRNVDTGEINGSLTGNKLPVIQSHTVIAGYASFEALCRARLYYAAHFTNRAVASMNPVAIFLPLLVEHFLFAAACRLRNKFLQTTHIDNFQSVE